MGKCDMCREYIDAGANPACVDACRTRSLEWGELADLQAKYGTVCDVPPLADSSQTSPSYVVNLHREAKKGFDDGLVTNTESELS